MRCCNCQNEINVGAIVCPYCHTNPIIFGSAPYQGIPVEGNIIGDVIGWFGSFFNGKSIFGSNDAKKKLAKNETEYIVIPWNFENPWGATKMWKCATCKTINLVGAKTCTGGNGTGCNRKFVN